mmetsp:Transcript_31632/g.69694  ORF Transcript_31632/g.69694 Transcript_31632/m.69694 type:complete len:273 (-) Transcript_31632:1064-1882(-)
MVVCLQNSYKDLGFTDLATGELKFQEDFFSPCLRRCTKAPTQARAAANSARARIAAYLGTSAPGVSCTSEASGVDASGVAGLRPCCSAFLAASAANLRLLENWCSVFSSAMISCRFSTRWPVDAQVVPACAGCAGVSRILTAVPSPSICSLPHTRHFSHVTQSMMREMLRNLDMNSSLRSCFASSVFQYCPSTSDTWNISDSSNPYLHSSTADTVSVSGPTPVPPIAALFQPYTELWLLKVLSEDMPVLLLAAKNTDMSFFTAWSSVAFPVW